MDELIKKYKVIHHFPFPPCLHYSSKSNKTWLSCNENWVEVPNWVESLEQVEIEEPEVLTKKEIMILKQWLE